MDQGSQIVIREILGLLSSWKPRLDLALTSYRLRDDDNIDLARIQAQALKAREAVIRRLDGAVDPERRAHRKRVLAQHQARQAASAPAKASQPGSATETASQCQLRPRQIVGQPAGPGLAQGPARVVIDPAEWMEFRIRASLRYRNPRRGNPDPHR